MADDKSSRSDESGPSKRGDKVSATEKLLELQEELEQINESEDKEMLELQQKYYEQIKPVYEKRKEIIKTIPKFWLTAFMSHPRLRSMVSEEDKKIFAYMESLDVELLDNDISGYTITFYFEPNPFFENTMLSKTIKNLNDEVPTSTGTIINWKEGKGPIDGSEYEKIGNMRPLLEDSFFKWFTNEDPVLMENYEVAELIRKELWRFSVRYLTKDDEDFVDGEDIQGEHDDDEEEGNDKDDEDAECSGTDI